MWSPGSPRYAVFRKKLWKWGPRNLQVEPVFLGFFYRLNGQRTEGGEEEGKGEGNVDSGVFSDPSFQVLIAKAHSYFLSFILLLIFCWLLVTLSKK